jgi:hypothetical protein
MSCTEILDILRYDTLNSTSTKQLDEQNQHVYTNTTLTQVYLQEMRRQHSAKLKTMSTAKEKRRRYRFRKSRNKKNQRRSADSGRYRHQGTSRCGEYEDTFSSIRTHLVV